MPCIPLPDRVFEECPRRGISKQTRLWLGDPSHGLQGQTTAGQRKGTNPTLKTTSGRARVNIHGALNLETFDTPFVAPITVDGVSAVQLLAKIEARNPKKRIIHVIRCLTGHVYMPEKGDNAAYHKGPDVRAFLSRKNCRIHLIQLPPYCPHLNPRSQACKHALPRND